MSMCFLDTTAGAARTNNSLLCVGLDTAREKLPLHLRDEPDAVVTFNTAVIEATCDFVCAYKPNSAFYEAMGSAGIESLKRTIDAVPDHIPVILDIKRGDIGNTALRYAAYAYDVLGVDAVTVNPYMGFDAVEPFLREGKGVFVLCLTSNPTADDFQTVFTYTGQVFEIVARKIAQWAEKGGVGAVVGATQPDKMKAIRDIVGDIPFLVPGVGAQGGDIEAVVDGCGGMPGRTIINSSRSILYASDGPDYAEKAREAAMKLRNAINEAGETVS